MSLLENIRNNILKRIANIPNEIINDDVESVSLTWSSDKIVSELDSKQDTLVSGTNIKTINSETILGSGNLVIEGGGHTQNTDTNLGTLGTKDPPVDADLVVGRNSASSFVLVTSTWTQIKAFLKTYFDGIYSILPLGETSATAYRGDRGKTAYDHSQVTHAPSLEELYFDDTYEDYVLGDTKSLNVFVDVQGTYSLQRLIFPNTFSSGTITINVFIINIRDGTTFRLDFNDLLNGSLPNIDLTNLDVGSSFIFTHSPTTSFWYKIL